MKLTILERFSARDWTFLASTFLRWMFRLGLAGAVLFFVFACVAYASGTSWRTVLGHVLMSMLYVYASMRARRWQRTLALVRRSALSTMALLAILALCLLAAALGLRGALLVPIVLWPIDRLPWPAAMLVAVVAFTAWRAFASRPRVPARSPPARDPRTRVIHGETIRVLTREELAR